jgi:hypothetical protein
MTDSFNNPVALTSLPTLGDKRDLLAGDLEVFGTSPTASVIIVERPAPWIGVVQGLLFMATLAYLAEIVVAALYWTLVPSCVMIGVVVTGLPCSFVLMATLGRRISVTMLMMGSAGTVISLIIHGAVFALVTVQPTQPNYLGTAIQAFAAIQWAIAAAIFIIAILRKLW